MNPWPQLPVDAQRRCRRERGADSPCHLAEVGRARRIDAAGLQMIIEAVGQTVAAQVGHQRPLRAELEAIHRIPAGAGLVDVLVGEQLGPFERQAEVRVLVVVDALPVEIGAESHVIDARAPRIVDAVLQDRAGRVVGAVLHGGWHRLLPSGVPHVGAEGEVLVAGERPLAVHARS